MPAKPKKEKKKSKKEVEAEEAAAAEAARAAEEAAGLAAEEAARLEAERAAAEEERRRKQAEARAAAEVEAQVNAARRMRLRIRSCGVPYDYGIHPDEKLEALFASHRLRTRAGPSMQFLHHGKARVCLSLGCHTTHKQARRTAHKPAPRTAATARIPQRSLYGAYLQVGYLSCDAVLSRCSD